MSTERYALRDYADMLKTDLHRVISDMEALIYLATGQPREAWDDETWSAFSRLRHKLLDKAGEIGRLPESLVEVEEDTF